MDPAEGDEAQGYSLGPASVRLVGHGLLAVLIAPIFEAGGRRAWSVNGFLVLTVPTILVWIIHGVGSAGPLSEIIGRAAFLALFKGIPGAMVGIASGWNGRAAVRHISQ